MSDPYFQSPPKAQLRPTADLGHEPNPKPMATTPPVRPVYRDSSPVGTIMDSPTGPQVVMMHDFSINVLQKLGQTDLSGSTSGNIFRSHASSPSLSNSIAFGSSEYPSCNLTGEVELERSLTGTDEASDFSPHKLHYNVQYTGDLNSSILSFSEEGHPQVDTKDYHGTAVLMTIKYDKIVKKFNALEEEMTQLKKDHLKSLQEKDSQIKALNNNTNSLSQELKMVKTQLSQKTEAYTKANLNFKEILDIAEKRRQEVQGDNSKLKQQIQTLKAELKKCKDDINQYKEIITEKSNSIAEMDNTLFNMQVNSSTSELWTQSCDKDKSIQKLTLELELKDKQINDKQVALDKRDSDIKTLEAKVASLSAEVSALSDIKSSRPPIPTHSTPSPATLKEIEDKLRVEIRAEYEEKYRIQEELLSKNEKAFKDLDETLQTREKAVHASEAIFKTKETILADKEDLLRKREEELAAREKLPVDNHGSSLSSSTTVTSLSVPATVNRFNIQYVLDYSLRERSLIVFKKGSSTFYLILLSFCQIFIWILLLSCGFLYLEVNNLAPGGKTLTS